MKTTSTSLCIAITVALAVPLPALADRGEFAAHAWFAIIADDCRAEASDERRTGVNADADA